jgi:hypothetical protein
MPLTISSFTPAVNYIDITFNEAVAALTLQAALTTYWTISGPTSVTVSAVSIISPQVVRLATNEHRQGGSYSLTMPLTGLMGTGGDQYAGAGVITYTGIGQAPTALLAQSIDVRHVRVIYSEAVQDAGALLASNYSISPALTVVGVTKESSTSFVLTTSTQTPSTTYTITVSNVMDLVGNTV